MSLKEKLIEAESNKFVKCCNNAVRKVHTTADNLILQPGQIYRALGGSDSKFIPLRNLKDKYSGERCFILATGPSLRREDVYSLENEYTFGMNSICKLYQETKWRPTFYGIQDLHVYDNVKDDIESNTNSTVFVGNNIAKKRNIPDTWIRFPLNTAYNNYQQNILGQYPVKFSENCYSVVYNGYSITFSLIEIAIYMGFKEIYLLGADCSFFANKPNHFLEHGHADAKIETAQARNFSMYQCAKEYAEQHRIDIYNATRGGALEIFQRVDFDAIEKK